MQMANCHRRLNQPDEARQMLERARVVRNRVQDADFRKTTRYSRQEWDSLLDWLITL